VIASSAYGSISFSLTNSAAGIPATITPLPPATQSAAVNRAYTQPLSVRVLDMSGAPVSGATVTFALRHRGRRRGLRGRIERGRELRRRSAQAIATTNSDGIATLPAISRANATIGRFTPTVTVANLPAPAKFQLENLPGKGVRLTRIGTATRAATVAHRYSHSLRVLVRDAKGNPEIGASVTFTLGGAGGGAGSRRRVLGRSGSRSELSPVARARRPRSPASTASQPRRRSPRAASPARSPRPATATTTTSTVHFTLRNRAGSPAAITPGIAASEATQAGTRFSIALAVAVTDTFGNKVRTRS